MRISAAIVGVFIVSLSIQSSASEVEEFFPDEHDALMQLRDIVNSTSNLHANWTGPPCSTKNQSRWVGVACSDWHITHLVLEGILLTGSLPPMFLQNLTFLSKLSFRNNSLHGPLPDLPNLMHLKFVFLSKNQFSGSIPFAYIDVPKLTKLELQENDLSGQIPPFNQQSLIAFNVSNNKLEGPIPQTPVLQRFPASSFANNSNLCGDIHQGLNSPCPISVPPPPSSPAPKKKRKDDGALKPWSIAVIAAAAALVLVCLILMFLCCYRRVLRKTKKDEVLPGDQVYVDVGVRGKQSHWTESGDDIRERSMELEFMEKPVFELDDLLRAAAEEIGRGELGITYKAMLECGSVVAVKRLKEMKALRKRDFVHQMHLLGNMKHENLVQMISFYHSKEEKLIVYEYVPDGSLFNLLHENRGIGGMALDWKTRVGMIKEIAKGVEFLHQRLGCERVPHGNLKSSNVLIQRHNNNNSIRVKLTDYGILSLVPAGKHKLLSVGTTPEYGDRKKKITGKADVYSFGILVLEIVTGRAPALSPPSPSASSSSRKSRDLSGWVRAAVRNDWSTDILDIEIVGEKGGYDDMLKLTEIALECTEDLPERRPKMTQVLARILDIIPD